MNVRADVTKENRKSGNGPGEGWLSDDTMTKTVDERADSARWRVGGLVGSQVTSAIATRRAPNGPAPTPLRKTASTGRSAA